MKPLARNSGVLLLCVFYLVEEGRPSTSAPRWPIEPPIDIIKYEADGVTVQNFYIRASKFLQSGAMARVYKVFNAPLILRIVRKNALVPRVDKTIQYEQLLQSSLKHEYVLELLDFFQDELFYYFVSEYAEGGDLLDILLTQPGNFGFLEKYAKYYFKQMILGLEYLHDMNIIHRDLKLENVLITYRRNENQLGPIPVVLIADFGFAVKLDSPDNYLIADDYEHLLPELGVAKSHHISGTNWYVSPDVLNDRIYSYKSDVYSLGIMLFIMITKQFPGEPRQAQNAIPEDRLRAMLGDAQASDLVQDLLVMMLKPNREDRYTLAQVKSHPWVAGTPQTRSITPHSYKENEESKIGENLPPLDTDSKLPAERQVTEYVDWEEEDDHLKQEDPQI